VSNIKSILIVGGSGFIGTHLALRLRDGYKVFATYNSKPISIPGVTCLPLNVENRNWIKRVVYTTLPDVIIYTAGSNNPEWSESHARQVEVLHSSGPATVCSATDIIQPRLIYLSNPYVFDGMKGNYHENDIILPSTVLGRMKLGGENVVKNKSLNYVILRSSPLFGRGNGINLSYLDRIRMRLDRKERIEASTHELHSFAPVHGLCDLVARLVDSGIRNRILHYGGLTKVTHYEFALAFAKRFKYDTKLVVRKKLLTRSPLSEDTRFDYSLNSTQSTETLKIKPLLLEEGFDLIEKNLISRL
jgi:dTDP-4-dehydrorhamnose reductase